MAPGHREALECGTQGLAIHEADDARVPHIPAVENGEIGTIRGLQQDVFAQKVQVFHVAPGPDDDAVPVCGLVDGVLDQLALAHRPGGRHEVAQENHRISSW